MRNTRIKNLRSSWDIWKLKPAFVLLLMLSGCIGTDQFDDLSGGTARVEIAGVSDEDDFDQINVGETVQYEASYFNAGGVEEQIAVEWSSSDNAIATIDANGLVTGIAPGTMMISAAAGGAMAERLIIVNALERIKLSASQTFLLINEELTVTASYFDENGMAANADFTWSSSDESIATVDASGVVSGLAQGMVEITASAKGLTSEPLTLNILTSLDQVAEVVISAAQMTVGEGEELPFQLSVFNANGDEVTNQTASWSSNNTQLLTINQDGVATGVAPGVVQVTATVDNVTSTPFEVVVTPASTGMRNGMFTGAGSYTVQGMVTMRETDSGVELEFSQDFSSSSGPGLYVYLSNTTSGGVSVGALPQNSGAFTLDAPNIGIDEYNYVLIWCEPFGVTFGSALLN